MGRESVQSLERALSILTLLSRGEGPVGVTRIAEQLHLPKSTVHRLLSTLQQSGFVYRNPEGRYGLGIRLWEIGCAAIRTLTLRNTALPVMQRLASETGETVCLATWDNIEGVYIDKVDGTEPTKLHASVGARLPAHATAAGLVLLAHQPAETQERIGRTLVRFTDKTIVEPEQLHKRLEEIRRHGCVTTQGAWYAGTGAVAAPIRAHNGEVVAALAVVSPTERLTRRMDLSRLVRAAADEISRSLSHGRGSVAAAAAGA